MTEKIEFSENQESFFCVPSKIELPYEYSNDERFSSIQELFHLICKPTEQSKIQSKK